MSNRLRRRSAYKISWSWSIFSRSSEKRCSPSSLLYPPGSSGSIFESFILSPGHIVTATDFIFEVERALRQQPNYRPATASMSMADWTDDGDQRSEVRDQPPSRKATASQGGRRIQVRCEK